MSTKTESIVAMAPVASYRLMGEQVDIMLAGEMTGQQMSLIVETSPPGGGPPPHAHTLEDETLIAIDFGFEVFRDERWLAMDAGGVAFLPRESVHTFRNTAELPGRIAAIFFPAGFERFFSEFADGLTDDNVEQQLYHAAAQVGAAFFFGDAHAN